MRGYPTLIKAAPAAYDRQVAERLWAVSEKLTDVTYSFLEPA
jgi:hypothetical protein